MSVILKLAPIKNEAFETVLGNVCSSQPINYFGHSLLRPIKVTGCWLDSIKGRFMCNECKMKDCPYEKEKREKHNGAI